MENKQQKSKYSSFRLVLVVELVQENSPYVTWKACLFMNYMCSFQRTDLYGDEDDVGADSSQCSVAQNVAGVDDTHNKEHWGGQHEAPKQHCLKYLVAIVGQNINHLDGRQSERNYNYYY